MFKSLKSTFNSLSLNDSCKLLFCSLLNEHRLSKQISRILAYNFALSNSEKSIELFPSFIKAITVNFVTEPPPPPPPPKPPT